MVLACTAEQGLTQTALRAVRRPRGDSGEKETRHRRFSFERVRFQIPGNGS